MSKALQKMISENIRRDSKKISMLLAMKLNCSRLVLTMFTLLNASELSSLAHVWGSNKKLVEE